VKLLPGTQSSRHLFCARDQEFTTGLTGSAGASFSERVGRVQSETRRHAQTAFDPLTHTPNYNGGEWAVGAPSSGRHGYSRGPMTLQDAGPKPKSGEHVPSYIQGGHQPGLLGDLLHRPLEVQEPAPFQPATDSQFMDTLRRHHVAAPPRSYLAANAFQFKPTGMTMHVTANHELVGQQYQPSQRPASTHTPLPSGFYRSEQMWTGGADVVGPAAREAGLTTYALTPTKYDSRAYVRAPVSGAVYSRTARLEQ